MGLEGLKLLREAGDRFGLLVISEVMEISQISLMMPFVDILQVGARNMQNFNLLRELGKEKKPVLLKRGIASTIEELLLSAEYIMAGGNYEVILCERGIRTFETYTRNTLDICAIPIVHKLSLVRRSRREPTCFSWKCITTPIGRCPMGRSRSIPTSLPS
jgi:3-deoxy-7-phosphoheptulonate synthase